MPQKQVSVVAQAELTYQGQRRTTGEVFDAGLVDSIVLARKNLVRRIGKAFTARPPKATPVRRGGTYNRRDMVAEGATD